MFILVSSVPQKAVNFIIVSDQISYSTRTYLSLFLLPLLTAAFHEKTDLNRFLAVLPTKLACDIILWTYHIEDEDDANFFYFSVDLDLGTFCNDGGIENTNIEWKAGQHVDTATAARPIAKGEEILCDYEDYEEEDDNEED